MNYSFIVFSLIVLIGCSHVEKRERKVEVATVGRKATDDTPEQKAMADDYERKMRVKDLVVMLADASIEKRQAAYVELQNKMVRKRDIPDLMIEVARNPNPEVTEALQKLINFIEGKWRLPDEGWTEDVYDLCAYEEEFEKFKTSVELSNESERRPCLPSELIFFDFPNDVESQLGVINLILTLEPETIKLAKDCKNVSFIDLGVFTNLKQLNLEDTKVVDLTPLKGMPNLTVLNLENTKVADLTPLKSLTNLDVLNLKNTKVADLTPLRSLTNLSSLNLSDTQVANLIPLNVLVKLRLLNLGKTRVSDMTPLEGLKNLHALDLANTRVSDLTPLNGLTNLFLLNLENTKVADLAPLKSLTNLGVLNLEKTNVSDLTPLNGFINLFSLNLRATQVADLSPLKRLVKLRHLYLYRTKVVDLTPLEGMSVNIYGYKKL